MLRTKNTQLLQLVYVMMQKIHLNTKDEALTKRITKRKRKIKKNHFPFSNDGRLKLSDMCAT